MDFMHKAISGRFSITPASQNFFAIHPVFHMRAGSYFVGFPCLIATAVLLME